MIDTKTSERIRAIRTLEGVSQERMARRLRVHLNTYAIMENTGRMGYKTRNRILRYIERHTAKSNEQLASQT